MHKNALFPHKNFKNFLGRGYLLNVAKFGTLAWCSIKICVIFGVQFGRRKVDRKANLHENWNVGVRVERYSWWGVVFPIGWSQHCWPTMFDSVLPSCMQLVTPSISRVSNERINKWNIICESPPEYILYLSHIYDYTINSMILKMPQQH